MTDAKAVTDENQFIRRLNISANRSWNVGE